MNKITRGLYEHKGFYLVQQGSRDWVAFQFREDAQALLVGGKPLEAPDFIHNTLRDLVLFMDQELR